MGKHAAFGSYLHHGPNDQRHLPGYQPKRGKDLHVETQERKGLLCSEGTRLGRVHPDRIQGEGPWLLDVPALGEGTGVDLGPPELKKSLSSPPQDLSLSGA